MTVKSEMIIALLVVYLVYISFLRGGLHITTEDNFPTDTMSS